MSLAVILRPRAETDIQDNWDELETVRAGLGDQFRGRVRDVLRRIESMPELYGVVWRDVRAAQVKRSRHVVYYIIFPDRVEVLAVMHGGRDASAWQRRV